MLFNSEWKFRILPLKFCIGKYLKCFERFSKRFFLLEFFRRLRAPGRPFVAYYPGMTREALAYYGCAELFQVHYILTLIMQLILSF